MPFDPVEMDFVLLGQGKKLYDKRDDDAKKQAARSMERAFKSKSYD